MIGPIHSALLLCCSTASIIAEVIALIMPDKILKIIERSPEEMQENKTMVLMGILSALYILNIIFLITASDKVFKLYGIILVSLSVSVWIIRKWLKHFKPVMIAESTLCLIVLIDVVRTTVARYL